MNLAFKIARKYFFSGKINGVVHIISAISMLGVLVGTAALIIILSVFNGFESLVLSLYNTFDPDVKIMPAQGKYFSLSDEQKNKLDNLNGLIAYSPIIEENVLLRYGEEQTFAKIKGIEPHFLATTGIDTTVFLGSPLLFQNGRRQALVGMGVSAKLSISVYNDYASLKFYLPKADKKVILNPRKAFNEAKIAPGGIFSIQKDFDDKYVLTPYSFAADLTKHPNELTALELNFDKGFDLDKAKALCKKALGDGFIIQDRFEQHSFLYKILRSEKLAVYLILTFVLLIAAFNLIGSLTMLSIEKKKDVAIIASLGAERNLIKKVFLYQGLMLSFTGAFSGILIGTLICWIQQKYSIIQLGGGTFVTEAYPVEFNGTDHILVAITVFGIGYLASYFPAKTAANKIDYKQLQAN